MEVRGEVRGVTVIDDFAHHPTAIRETISAVRSKYKGARILAVLEPRSNTMKLGTMKDQLAASLMGAERIFCYQSPSVQWDAAEALTPIREKAAVEKDLDALVRRICREAREDDVILVMSNGGFGGIHGKLLAQLGA